METAEGKPYMELISFRFDHTKRILRPGSLYSCSCGPIFRTYKYIRRSRADEVYNQAKVGKNVKFELVRNALKSDQMFPVHVVQRIQELRGNKQRVPSICRKHQNYGWNSKSDLSGDKEVRQGPE